MNQTQITKYLKRNFENYAMEEPYRIPHFNSSRKKSALQIEKNFLDKCLKLHRTMIEKYGYDEFYSATDREAPLVLLLGQKGNSIVDGELIENYSGGCGEMLHLTPDKIASAMYKLVKRKLFPAGFMRIGFFEDTLTGNENGMDMIGPVFETLSSNFNGQGLCFISLGINLFQVHFMGEGRFNEIPYKIIRKGGKKHGSNKSNPSTTLRSVTSKQSQGRHYRRRVSGTARH